MFKAMSCAAAFLAVASITQDTKIPVFRSANYHSFNPGITDSRLMAAFRIAIANQREFKIGTQLEWQSFKTGRLSTMYLVSKYSGGRFPEEHAMTKNSPCYVFKLEGEAVLKPEKLSANKIIDDDDITHPDQQPYATFCVDLKLTKPAPSESLLRSAHLGEDVIASYMRAYPAGTFIPSVFFNYSRPVIFAQTR